MKFLVLLVASVFGLIHCQKFQEFTLAFQKSYKPTEYASKAAVYQKNLKLIDRLNAEAQAKGLSYRAGVNKFSDQDSAQVLKKLATTKQIPASERPTTPRYQLLPKARLPTSIDWVKLNKVSPVRDQGDCGSCWAFATITAVESRLAIKTGVLTAQSEQMLVDCVKKNGGCDGGYPGYAGDYLVKNGSMLLSSYGYTEIAGSCKFNAKRAFTKTKGLRINTIFWNTVNAEDALKYAVATYGPVQVDIYVGEPFINYNSGILYDPDCETAGWSDINHSVVVVGYGTENGVNYWLLRNSWGASWGINGYFKIPMGKRYCGLTAQVLYFI